MRHRTIMIIDDTPDHRDILRRLLRGVGYQVLEAASGSEAIDQVKGEQPDLILMALPPPERSGWETARLLRSHPTLAQTPILGTTVYNTLLSTRLVRDAGYADYVDKPFDIDALIQRINTMLGEGPQSAFA